MNQIESELHELAGYLWERKNAIIEKWEKTAKENDQKYSSLLVLSKSEFYNNIPDFIFHLGKQLRNEENKIKEISQEHGAHRWKVNLDLREVLDEWELLYQVLTDEINRSAEKITISLDSLNQAHQQVSRTVFQGIKISIYEYYKSQKLETQAQVVDLEETLKEHSEQSDLQGHNLRQASHDLGGSVALIQMNLHLLKKKKLPDDAGELVKNLSLAAENLVNMFKSLLDLFRLEAGDEKLEINDFDAAELLQGLQENMQPLAEKRNLEIISKGVDSLPVRGDMVKIRRIAQNLVMNSLKYTEEGCVEISWSRKKENHWELCIRDTGPGFHATHAAPFTKSGKKRTVQDKAEPAANKPDEIHMHSEGIGLSIVRRLCELLEAVVVMESEEGKGTQFRIIFPADYPKAHPSG
ncbi:MAG: HAMP domain-containing sensor histidine kinase [Balneolaceae bacterium]